MDIYVWSIEDTHQVRVEAHGIRLTVAAFSDVRVARNFRDWIAGLDGLDYLCQQVALSMDSDYIGDMRLHNIVSLIVTRRAHKAHIWNDSDVDIRFRRLSRQEGA